MTGTMVHEGFRAVETLPGIYRHAEWDVTVSCHGNDFLAEGCTDGLDLTRISFLHGCYVVSVLITLESCFLVLQPVVSLDH